MKPQLKLRAPQRKEPNDVITQRVLRDIKNVQTGAYGELARVDFVTAILYLEQINSQQAAAIEGLKVALQQAQQETKQAKKRRGL